MTTPLTVEQVQEIARQEIALFMLHRIEAKLDLLCPEHQTNPDQE